MKGNGDRDDDQPNKNGSGFHVKLGSDRKHSCGSDRKHSCTHKKHRLSVDQEYEMKPMLGIRTSKLLEKQSSHSSKEKLGNGDLNKYKSVSTEDNTLEEPVGRFINVTQLTDIEIESPDDINENVRTTDEVIEEDDVNNVVDFTEEAPQHKISVAKSTCSECKAEFRDDKTEDLEERFEEMSSNMQRLESKMETLISLLERNGVGNTPSTQARSTGEERDFNCTVTSV